MQKYLIRLLLVVLSLLAVGCGGGGGNNEPTLVQKEINLTITDDVQANSWKGKGNFKLNINIGNTPKDVYLLLTNDNKNRLVSASISRFSNTKIVSSPQNKIEDTYYTEQNNNLTTFNTPKYVSKFNRDLSRLKKITHNTRSAKSLQMNSVKRASILGDRTTFYLDEDSTMSTVATAKKIVSNISTKYGSKTLNVWVSDDSFDDGSGCAKETCVTQDMVDELAGTFLQDGEDNDIYDWVTNIYGEEWGEVATYSNLIAESSEITILLTDIDSDNNANAGTIGYFYSKDNYTDISGSNKRVMFYIDSVMFANTEYGDYFQKEVYSTLAHEFTHMIEFYQKQVLRETSHDIWVSEMLAETTEDLVATKLKHDGPRGVEYTDGSAGDPGNINGRYPLLNQYKTHNLRIWNYRLLDYSEVSAFGAFLIRNFGGAKVLHDIMYSRKKDETAILEAIYKTPQGKEKNFFDLLRDWNIAILLSAIENPEDLPTYNTGGFKINNYNGIEYQLGSINFYNYAPQPKINASSNSFELEDSYYHLVGKGISGDISISLKLNDTAQVTLITK